MFKKALVFTTIGSLAFAANLAAAAPVGTENAKHFKLRSDAVEVAEGVYKLGRAYDAQTHELVEGYAIVHKKRERPSQAAVRRDCLLATVTWPAARNGRTLRIG